MNTRKRSLTFDIKDQAQQLFFLEHGSPFDQLEFYIEQDELIVSCQLPKDAIAGNQIRAAANHQDNRSVDFIGQRQLQEQDIIKGTIELRLSGTGKCGPYNLQLSLLGHKERIKNSMDYMAYLPREIRSSDIDCKSHAAPSGSTSGVLYMVAKYIRNEFSTLFGSSRQAYLTERK
ncbi:hypothetical protein CWB99_00940 [Pseudoalteromonas rubra]|uniref:Uncharacterized protein n=1 Tax=Pseudoalteromonas rubra TaxID=43658 RepID=A0A5S3WUD8_9GAMM|nr:hypothetical protein [Pseudoalteromonas rubra]TMP31671.1 hypothetical protein CWC00_13695 [Pseudoalteromonas rubra]TMP33248.1 hypothetical protein CWB99_00940 [Pseudoalteromonas rubra]